MKEEPQTEQTANSTTSFVASNNNNSLATNAATDPSLQKWCQGCLEIKRFF